MSLSGPVSSSQNFYLVWLQFKNRLTDRGRGSVQNVSFEPFYPGFLFGLLIKRDISDKASNCFNVVSVTASPGSNMNAAMVETWTTG